ncbi:DUF3047 domain-containing protein [Aurantivibrio plasticivorans]
MLQRISVFTFTLVIAVTALAAPPKQTVVGDFSSGQVVGWDEESFSGNTEYLIVEQLGVPVLQASSRASASGLTKKVRIDLWQYPYLNWSWMINNRLPERDHQTKAGDDYPVRIYLIIDGGLKFWKSKAINYVWSYNLAKGSAWPNAYAGNNVVMIAARDGSDDPKRWYNEKRNVLQDLQKYVGPDVRYIDGIALMTDTDDTSSFVNSFYGDIYFSNE